jgi:hypothetical protein
MTTGLPATVHAHLHDQADQAENKPQRLRVVIQTHELQVTSNSGKLLQAAGYRLAKLHTNCTY